MAHSPGIIVESRVEGCHGPLATNTNPSIKRRRRVKVVGTVLRAVGAHKWDVQFDFDGKSKEVHSKSLVNVPESSGIPLDEQTDANLKEVSYHCCRSF